MSTAVTNDEIAKQLEKHDQHLTRLTDTVDRIEKDIEPITLVYMDIAAVGRVGRKIGNFIKWFAAVSLAFTGAWAAVKGFRPW